MSSSVCNVHRLDLKGNWHGCQRPFGLRRVQRKHPSLSQFLRTPASTRATPAEVSTATSSAAPSTPTSTTATHVTATPLADAPPSAATGTTINDAVQVLDERTAPEALRDITTLILDCDGVLWRGSDIIRNAPEALRLFRRQGKRLLFVTNNSSKSRAEYAAKFAGLGLEVSPEEIVSSSYCAAAYLSSLGFGAQGASSGSTSTSNNDQSDGSSSGNPSSTSSSTSSGSSSSCNAGAASSDAAGVGAGKKVLLLGWSGVEQELQAAGIPFLGGRGFQVPPMHDIDAMKQLQVDPAIGAVVVGWDPGFSYSRLVYASVCLRELPDCLLVATNTDCADHIGGGRMMPGTGGLVRAVEIASGVRAVNVAKGGEWLLPYLCRTYNLDPSRTAIIGDRMDTDIVLGRQGGLRTCLPLTGVTTLPGLAALPREQRPDVVVRSVAQLAGLEA